MRFVLCISPRISLISLLEVLLPGNLGGYGVLAASVNGHSEYGASVDEAFGEAAQHALVNLFQWRNDEACYRQ